MSRDLGIVFPDTNSLLHYPPIRDLDWLGLCDAKFVRIVLCMQVIHEVDDKTSDHRLEDRAMRAVKEISKIRDAGGAVREGVTLEFYNREPVFADFPDSLSPDSFDDRIIFLLQRFEEETGESGAAVFSEDLGMRLRCEANGVPTITPKKEDRLDPPQSDRDKKYKKAITELNDLKSQAPNVSLRIVSKTGRSEQPCRIVLTPCEVTSDVESEVEKRRKRLAVERPKPPQRQSSADRFRVAMERIGAAQRIPSEEFDRYERELETYLEIYRNYVEQHLEFLEIKGRIFEFGLELENLGNAPADGLEAVMKFPPVLQFLSDGSQIVGTVPSIP